MRCFDVIVVGGGPIGAVAARTAAEEGASVLLVEQRAEPQRPPACTALVSPRTLEVLGVPDAVVVRRIRGVVVHAPGGGELHVESDEEKALVLDRRELELSLLASAGAAGVEVRRGIRADRDTQGKLRLRGYEGSATVEGRVVIGADGPHSSVARWSNLRVGGVVAARAIQAELAVPCSERGSVDVFVGRHVAPGYFAWAVPAERDRIRVGLTVDPGRDPRALLDRLLADRFPEATPLSVVEAWIPIPPGGPTIADGVLLVGDAAAQVKSLSGGGLYFGSLCARIAGRVAARAAQSGNVSAASLRPYEDACQAAIGPEIRFGSAIRSILQGLSDDGIDAVIDVLQDDELRALAAERGDIDRLGQLLLHAASHPRLWKRLLGLWTAVRKADGDAPAELTTIASPECRPL
jgi:digeranylgeranylglycerophospholipid reductase